MPLSSHTFTLYQAWIRAEVLDTGALYTLPVDTLRILPVAVSGQGSTAVELWDFSYAFDIRGIRHDLELSYNEVPSDNHADIVAFVNDLLLNRGRVEICLAEKDANGTLTVDTARSLTVVADFDSGFFDAQFEQRIRSRPLTMQFKGESLQQQVHGWMSD